MVLKPPLLAPLFSRRGVALKQRTFYSRKLVGGINLGTHASHPWDIEVSNEAARLSLDPVTTTVGKKVHQVDNDTVYQLNALPAVTVSGTSADGIYVKIGTSNGKDYYNITTSGGYLNGDGDTTSGVVSYQNETILKGWTIFGGSDPFYTSFYELVTLGLPASIADGAPGSCRIRYAGILDLTLSFDVSSPISASSGDQAEADATIAIGIADSPTRTAIAAKIASLVAFSNFPFLTATSSGEQVLIKDSFVSAMGGDFAPDSNPGNWTIDSVARVPQNVVSPDLVTTWYDLANLGIVASVTVTLGTYVNPISPAQWSVVSP